MILMKYTQLYVAVFLSPPSPSLAISSADKKKQTATCSFIFFTVSGVVVICINQSGFDVCPRMASLNFFVCLRTFCASSWQTCNTRVTVSVETKSTLVAIIITWLPGISDSKVLTCCCVLAMQSAKRRVASTAMTNSECDSLRKHCAGGELFKDILCYIIARDSLTQVKRTKKNPPKNKNKNKIKHKHTHTHTCTHAQTQTRCVSH